MLECVVVMVAWNSIGRRCRCLRCGSLASVYPYALCTYMHGIHPAINIIPNFSQRAESRMVRASPRRVREHQEHRAASCIVRIMMLTMLMLPTPSSLLRIRARVFSFLKPLLYEMCDARRCARHVLAMAGRAGWVMAVEASTPDSHVRKYLSDLTV